MFVCYSGCRANQAVYEVAQLRLRPGLNLDDVVNITNVSEGNTYSNCPAATYAPLITQHYRHITVWDNSRSIKKVPKQAGVVHNTK